MKMKTKFFLPMIIPTITAQQKGLKIVRGKPIFFEKPAVRDARLKFAAALTPHRPKYPTPPPVQVILKFIFKGKQNDFSWHTGKPDVDNLTKLFLDVLADCGFVEDDKHIASLTTEKFYGPVPGIWVSVQTG